MFVVEKKYAYNDTNLSLTSKCFHQKTEAAKRRAHIYCIIAPCDIWKTDQKKRSKGLESVWTRQIGGDTN